MEDNRNKIKTVNLRKLFKLLVQRKRLFYKVWAIVFVLSCIWIFPQPRYYVSSVTVAPETGGAEAGGGLSSIASSFGINIGGMANNDAIYPILYPDLFESPEFTTSLYDIKITTSDGELTTDYYTYMTKHQQSNWLTQPFKDAMKWVIGLFKSKKESWGGDGERSAFRMSEEDFALMESIQNNITCAVDQKTDVTTITVQDQDALVSALLADSVKQRLQDFITQYRTSKARMDVEYYQELASQAFHDYEVALKEYSDYCDTHKNTVLQAYISEREELENKMSLKFNTYNALNVQLETAKAKVQERTPSFTTLKSVVVPVKPAGPKRMLFVLGMLFLSSVITAYWISRGQIMEESV
ncbi:MAG: chain-length determining protein [Bacteroidaceae bacterium]|nr:chain-length determining protein [Bacteroidaceae bacterium]